jgi:Protein of unknown function (DUF3106)
MSSALVHSLLSCALFFGLSSSLSLSNAQTNPQTPHLVTQATGIKAQDELKPLWSELTADQRQSLSPLQAEWPRISKSQKRKWLEVSKNFNKLTADEQVKLHSRMKEWVALTPQQRAQARLNFSATKELPPEKNQQRWDAYLALSPEEREKLQQSAQARPNSAALANKPQNKLAPNSKLPASTSPETKTSPPSQ